MSDYVRLYDFSAKDALASGNPSKLVKGSEVDDEYDAVAVAIATKYDSGDLATQTQAEQETLNTVLITPLTLSYWSDYNAGVVGDLQAYTDPSADQMMFWDTSAGAVAWQTITGFTGSGKITLDTSPTLSSPTISGTLTLGATAITATGAELNVLDGFTGDVSDLNKLASVTASASELNALDGGLTLGGGQTITDTDNLPLINGNNVFTAANQGISALSPQLRLVDSGGGTDGQQWNFRVIGGDLYLRGLTDAQAAAFTWAKISRTGTNCDSIALISDAITFTADNFTIAADGGLTTPNSTADEPGFKGAPQRYQTGDYTLVLDDAGRHVRMAGNGTTLTIPAQGSVAFPAGTVISVISQAYDVDIDASATQSFILSGTGGTQINSSTLTLPAYSMITMLLYSSSNSGYWLISGPLGVS